MGKINDIRPRVPRHRWMDTLKSDLARITAPGTELAGSENREKWRGIL